MKESAVSGVMRDRSHSSQEPRPSRTLRNGSRKDKRPAGKSILLEACSESGGEHEEGPTCYCTKGLLILSLAEPN
jgi:hypothetical protein